MQPPPDSAFPRFFRLLTLLLLTILCRADEVPLQSFEMNPMAPDEWLSGTAVNHDDWSVTLGGSSATVTQADAADGAQSILISKGGSGTQTRVALVGRLPLADIFPVFVDFWLRPTSWSGTSASGTLHISEGTQIFVDGHYFCFRDNYSTGPLRLHSGPSYWQATYMTDPIPVWVPLQYGTGIRAWEWVRFTARIDPVTEKADVWLNGKLAVTDVPRLPTYAQQPFAPSFYLQGSSLGATGFDAFQCVSVNPLFGDMDSDGVPDAWELAHGLNISLNDRHGDPDDDGLTNLQEYIRRTLPENADSDQDLMPDLWEIENDFDPLFKRDGWQDTDFDGVPNNEEFIAGTNPRDAWDTPRTSTYVKAADPMALPYFEDGTIDWPYSTLQAAINATAEGGAVVVVPGNYTLSGSGNCEAEITRSIEIRGNGVTLDGTGETLDENGNPVMVPMWAGLRIFGGDVVVEDLNFVNCTRYEGGALYADGLMNPWSPTASVTLRRCSFAGCHAPYGGGAVRLFHVPTATVEDCAFHGCRADYSGGALSAESTNLTVQRSRFSGNSSLGDGGALHLSACAGTLENSLFTYNYARNGGAAVLMNDTTTAVSFCTVAGNSSYEFGAGL